MDEKIMDDMQVAQKKVSKQKSVDNNVNDVITKLGETIANAIDASNQKRYTNANIVNLDINEKIKQKADRQIAFQKRIINDLKAKRNCRMYAIPTIYKEYQPSFTVSINGCTIKVPADGQQRLIHNRYIDIIERRLRHLDKKIEAMNKADYGEITNY